MTSVMPSGWKESELSELGKCIRGVSYNPEVDLRERDSADSVRLLRSNNVQDGTLDLTSLQFVSKVRVSPQQNMSSGDILICMANGSKQLVGKAARFEIRREHPYTFGAFMGIFRPFDKTDSDFIYFVMQSKAYRTYLDIALSGSSINNLRPSNILEMIFVIPERDERKRISNALVDLDLLVRELDKLIAKKREIKQGAMQQLLTGKTRLPGFAGIWQDINFGIAMKIRHGRSQKEVESVGGPYPIFGSGGEIGRSREAIYSKPSVLIGRKGTIDNPKFMDQPFWTVDTLFYSEVFDGYDAKFLYYKFCMVDWYRYNEASGVPSLNASVIEKIETSTPSLVEQQAISGVLSDMDAEIDALVAKREKTALIKTGMVQELLTGRTRLL